MIRECNVILNNPAATVIVFDGKEVQLPPINKSVSKIFVDFKDGRYSICEKPTEKKKVKKVIKETAVN